MLKNCRLRYYGYRQQGVVLVSCLLLILVLSVLVVSGLENSQLELRKVSYYQGHAQLMQAVEQGLLVGERSIQLGVDAACVCPTEYNTFYAEQSVRWWRRQCRWDGVDGIEVAYVIEVLPESVCVLDQAGLAAIRARYWRVTARAWSDVGGWMVLQSTFVAADSPLVYCDMGELVIDDGRQAWRRLSE